MILKRGRTSSLGRTFTGTATRRLLREPPRTLSHCGTVRPMTRARLADAPGPVPEVLWSPAADARERSRMGRYLGWLATERGLALADYDAAWRWSVDQPGAFWQSIWDHFEVRASALPKTALADASM